MKYLSAALLLAVGMMLLSAAPLGSAAAPTHLTNGVSQSGMKLATIDTYQGVVVNYTSTYSTAFDSFVYLTLVNHAGQVVYWNVASCSFSAAQEVQCFVSISPAVPSGTYTAMAFATTDTGVPVSVVSSHTVTL
ncbi:MAG: hypothetical protein JRM74_03770 [Nitrososphaerota archaeon]|nr:hypothetical protein [Nitrososphaerota archaeon]